MSDLERPAAHIQWKGTDACLDVYCVCGTDLHFDGEFAYELTCGACRRIWQLPAVVPLEEITEPDYKPIVLQPER